jgi:hypothetical protein
MAAPFEVVAGPLTVFVAPVGTAFPLVNAAPPGTWFKLGTNGPDNFEENGVMVTHNQTLNPWRSAASTVARKVFRSAEEFLLEFTLVDLTIEQYAKVMNDATVSTTVGPPATKDINLMLGTAVTTFAMIARGVSPINDTLPAQYQVPIVYQGARRSPPTRRTHRPASTSSSPP